MFGDVVRRDEPGCRSGFAAAGHVQRSLPPYSRAALLVDHRIAVAACLGKGSPCGFCGVKHSAEATRQTSLTVSSVGFVKFRQCSFRVTFRTGTEKVQHGIGDRGPVRFPLVWDAQMYPAALVDFSHCIPGTTGTGRGSNVRMFGQSKSLVVQTVRRCTPRSLMKMSLRPTRNAVVVQSVRNIRPMSVHTTGTSFPLARPKRRPAMWRSSQPKPNAASTADIIGRWWYSGTTRRHVNIRRWCPDRWTPGTGGKFCFSLVPDSLPKRGESAPRGACAHPSFQSGQFPQGFVSEIPLREWPCGPTVPGATRARFQPGKTRWTANASSGWITASEGASTRCSTRAGGSGNGSTPRSLDSTKVCNRCPHLR